MEVQSFITNAVLRFASCTCDDITFGSGVESKRKVTLGFKWMTQMMHCHLPYLKMLEQMVKKLKRELDTKIQDQGIRFTFNYYICHLKKSIKEFPQRCDLYHNCRDVKGTSQILSKGNRNKNLMHNL